jgi:hypothetical protein
MTANTLLFVNHSLTLSFSLSLSLFLLLPIRYQYCFEIMIFMQQPNKFTWMGVVLVLGSLVAIGIEKVKESRKVIMTVSTSPTKNRLKQRTSDLPSGSADSVSSGDEGNNLPSKRPTNSHADEETLELMTMNGNAQGKAE